jgi:hypothetical protein
MKFKFCQSLAATAQASDYLCPLLLLLLLLLSCRPAEEAGGAEGAERAPPPPPPEYEGAGAERGTSEELGRDGAE